MRKLLSLLMGVNECATPAELRRQYQRLVAGFMAAEAESTPDQIRRYQKARERLSLAYESTKKQLTKADTLHGSVTGSGLLLGELLIDAEMISPEQLDDALAAQNKTKPPLPLGRILVARKWITWEQLAFFLKMQDLLQLPVSHSQRFSRQLIELGLATPAEMEIVELDCETTGCSLGHAMERRGWIKLSLLCLLIGAPEAQGNQAKDGSQNVTALSGKLFAKIS